MGLFSGRSERIAYMDVQGKLEDMRKNGRDILKGAQKNSLAALGQGYNDAMGRLQPYADTGGKAFQQYADATGVNGQEGYDRSAGNFRASPGYQWAVDQATDGVARKASALGVLGSGNTMAEISDRAGHMADQEYDDYLSRLSGLGQVGYDAAGKQAGLDTQLGQDKTSLYTHIADARVANNWDATNPLVQARMGIADAGSRASANAWGLGMNIAKAGLGFLGGQYGGSMLSKIIG